MGIVVDEIISQKLYTGEFRAHFVEICIDLCHRIVGTDWNLNMEIAVCDLFDGICQRVDLLHAFAVGVGVGGNQNENHHDERAEHLVHGADIDVFKGEIFSLRGGNGSGKTTLLSVIAGIEKAYRGKLTVLGKNIKKYSPAELHRGTVAMLPQDVSTVFIKNTVRDDLFDICRAVGCSKDEAEQKIAAICGELSITEVLSRHPYDLSGGEAQRAALAKVLLTEPEILLLDEPTKAVDACAKRVLTGILRRLAESGVTVFAARHDKEFAAEISDRCAMLFDGSVICPLCPQVFFRKNDFYTTSSSRISRGVFENTVTTEQVVALGKGADK